MSFGPLGIVPKIDYIIMKRTRQFTMIAPKSNTRIEIGINLKLHVNNDLFKIQPQGSMCQYVVNLTSINDIDNPLINMLRLAY